MARVRVQTRNHCYGVELIQPAPDREDNTVCVPSEESGCVCVCVCVRHEPPVREEPTRLLGRRGGGRSIRVVVLGAPARKSSVCAGRACRARRCSRGRASGCTRAGSSTCHGGVIDGGGDPSGVSEIDASARRCACARECACEQIMRHPCSRAGRDGGSRRRPGRRGRLARARTNAACTPGAHTTQRNEIQRDATQHDATRTAD